MIPAHDRGRGGSFFGFGKGNSRFEGGKQCEFAALLICPIV